MTVRWVQNDLLDLVGLGALVGGGHRVVPERTQSDLTRDQWEIISIRFDICTVPFDGRSTGGGAVVVKVNQVDGCGNLNCVAIDYGVKEVTRNYYYCGVFQTVQQHINFS